MRMEGILKSRCLEQLRKNMTGAVVLNHQEVRLNGVPDVSNTFHGRTTWWEFKHGTPHFDSNGIQELTMLRLAAAGFARYIIYLEDAKGLNKRTLIIHPRHLKDLTPEDSCLGHNHQFVVDYIRKAHDV